MSVLAAAPWTQDNFAALHANVVRCICALRIYSSQVLGPALPMPLPFRGAAIRPPIDREPHHKAPVASPLPPGESEVARSLESGTHCGCAVARRRRNRNGF